MTMPGSRVSRVCRALAALLWCLSIPNVCLSAQQEPPPRPRTQWLRQNEDWSRFRAGEEADAFDRLKHIDLDSEGWAWLSVGGRVDARWESWDGFGFGAQPSNQDSFLLSRAMAHGDLHFGDRFRVFVEGKTSHSTSRNLPGGRRGLDVDTFEVQQAFADWNVFSDDEQSLRVRFGREQLLFGAQRLVSPLPWANTLRHWDTISADYTNGPWAVKAFYAQFVPVRKRRFNEVNDDIELYGVYATRRPQPGGRGLDLYALGNTRPNVTVNGTTGNERRTTVGFRSWGPLPALGEGFDGEVEAAYQFGEIGNNSVTAWSGTGVLGFRPDVGELKPRLFVGVDAASGDSRTGGGVGTFHQLFPLGHAYFGWADVQGRQNVFAVHVGASAKLTPKTIVKAVAHTFRKLERNDAFYFVNGAPSAAQPSGREIAQEVDLHFKHAINSRAHLYGGYSYVFAGDGLREDVSFYYLGAGWTF